MWEQREKQQRQQQTHSLKEFEREHVQQPRRHSQPHEFECTAVRQQNAIASLTNQVSSLAQQVTQLASLVTTIISKLQPKEQKELSHQVQRIIQPQPPQIHRKPPRRQNEFIFVPPEHPPDSKVSREEAKSDEIVTRQNPSNPSQSVDSPSRLVPLSPKDIPSQHVAVEPSQGDIEMTDPNSEIPNQMISVHE